MTVNQPIRETENKVPDDCVHCSRGWVLDLEETSFGEFEEVSHFCPACKGDYKGRV